MSRTVGGGEIRAGLIENRSRAVDPAKRAVGLVLNALDLKCIAHLTSIQEAPFDGIEAHALAKPVLDAIVGRILEPVGVGRLHAGSGLEDEKLVGRTGIVLVCEFAPDDVVPLWSSHSAPTGLGSAVPAGTSIAGNSMKSATTISPQSAGKADNLLGHPAGSMGSARLA